MEKTILKECTKKIEEKLGINKPGGGLNNSDYEYIAFLIEEKSKVRLSLSTIKRIWNDKYNRLPHISTLNALAQSLDFENWQSYRKTFIQNPVSKSRVTIKINKKYLIPVVVIIASVVVIIAFVHSRSNHNIIEGNKNRQGEIIFKNRNSVTKGVPNSVIFEYNINNYKADSFFIQQSWKELGKVQIYKNQYILTDIYYFPGYHMAKLIADTSIIKEIPVFIETDGWTGIINQENSKKYQTISKGIQHNGSLAINRDTLSYLGVDAYKEYYLRFYNMGNFGNIKGDNCQIDTRIKIENPSTSCPVISFGMNGEEGTGGSIKLTTKGCISNAYLYLNDTYLDGRINDLSDLGCDDITQWQLLSITIKEKHAEIRLNGKSVLKTSYLLPIGRITGFSYFFNGSGNVDYIRIKSLDGNAMYDDEFNGK